MAARDHAAAHALRARPPLAGARHLRADPDRQRGGAHDLGLAAVCSTRRPALAGPVELLPGLRYPAYRLLIIARRRSRVALLLCTRWCTKTRVGMLVRAGASNREMAIAMGVEHPAPLHARVRRRRGAVRGRRRDARAAPRGAGRHGREHPDPRLRGHRHRRHRLDPRRARRRAAGRHGRHASAARFLPIAFARASCRRSVASAAGPALASIADLRADGGGAVLPAAGPVPGARMMTAPRRIVAAVVLLARCSRCVHAARSDQTSTSASPAASLIYAIAATSLNLVLGYGGMVSFGHAAFFGAGAYVVGILISRRRAAAPWIAWPAAIAVAALAALVIGAISLRTRGVYFIMITLAFAQMMYYLAVSLKALRRRRRPARCRGALARPRPRPRQRRRLVLRRARRARRSSLYALHRLVAFALRPRDRARSARTRRAPRRSASRPTATSSLVLRHRRRDRRPRRRADRQPDRATSSPSAAALDPVGHADDHGDPRRRRPPLGRPGRRRGAAGLEEVLADYPHRWLCDSRRTASHRRLARRASCCSPSCCCAPQGIAGLLSAGACLRCAGVEQALRRRGRDRPMSTSRSRAARCTR